MRICAILASSRFACVRRNGEMFRFRITCLKDRLEVILVILTGNWNVSPIQTGPTSTPEMILVDQQSSDIVLI